jgi:hypothetical protein
LRLQQFEQTPLRFGVEGLDECEAFTGLSGSSIGKTSPSSFTVSP